MYAKDRIPALREALAQKISEGRALDKTLKTLISTSREIWHKTNNPLDTQFVESHRLVSVLASKHLEGRAFRRALHLTLGLLQGRTYRQCEPTSKSTRNPLHINWVGICSHHGLYILNTFESLIQLCLPESLSAQYVAQEWISKGNITLKQILQAWEAQNPSKSLQEILHQIAKGSSGKVLAEYMPRITALLETPEGGLPT